MNAPSAVPQYPGLAPSAAAPRIPEGADVLASVGITKEKIWSLTQQYMDLYVSQGDSDEEAMQKARHEVEKKIQSVIDRANTRNRSQQHQP